MQADRGPNQSLWSSPAFPATSFRLAWLLALLATLVLEIVTAQGESTEFELCSVIVAEVLAVLVLHYLLGRVSEFLHIRAQFRYLLLLSLATLAFLVEVFVRSYQEAMLPLELLLLAGFRNGVLVLAADSHRADSQKLCCAMSTFLIIFASTLGGEIWIQILILLFAAMGMWWLMTSYWESLHDQLASSNVQQRSRWWFNTIPSSVIVLLTALPFMETPARVLRGFMPSSGGAESNEYESRRGVGDGESLVAGTDQIRSFAAIEDAPFLNSHQPSLYDLFDESYEEPVRPQKQDRSIALSSEFAAKQDEHNLAQNENGSKSFSTARKSRQKRSDSRSEEVRTAAIMSIKGRTPLHLKLETYDRFDGVDWYPEQPSHTGPALRVENLYGRPWIRPDRPLDLDVYGVPETHAIRIIRMDTNRIPSPNQFLGIHIAQLADPQMFRWAMTGLLQMDRDQLPAFTTLHIQSRVVDEQKLVQFKTGWKAGPARFRRVNSDNQSRQIADLAAQWTKGLPEGWPQISAIIKRIRQDYQLDVNARPDPDSPHTAADFLFRTRRGTDYQFASATVCLLRSLGYSSRLASGFYANPARHDPRTQEIPILKEDVHFWPEVNLLQEQWVTLEPTPGYKCLECPPTLFRSLSQALTQSLLWIKRQIIPLSLAFVLAIIAFLRRKQLLDQLHWFLWFVSRSKQDRVMLRKTLQLLDSRCRRAGLERPSGVTSARWLKKLKQEFSCRTELGDSPLVHDVAPETLDQFIRLADWACFAPVELLHPIQNDSNPPSAKTHHTAELCEKVVRWFSFHKLKLLTHERKGLRA